MDSSKEMDKNKTAPEAEKSEEDEDKTAHSKSSPTPNS